MLELTTTSQRVPQIRYLIIFSMSDPLIDDIKSDSTFKILNEKHNREKKQLESKHDSEMKELHSRQQSELKEVELRLLLTKYRELERSIHPIKQESVIIDTSDDEEYNQENEKEQTTKTPTPGKTKKTTTVTQQSNNEVNQNSILLNKRRKSRSTTPTAEKKARIEKSTKNNIKAESNILLRRSRRLSRLDPVIIPFEHLRDDPLDTESDELLTLEEYNKLNKTAKLSKSRIRLPRNIFQIDDYTHFIQKWFYGNSDPFVIPLVDLKKRVIDWKSLVDPVSYYKYEKVGNLLERVFPDIRANITLVNKIDHLMVNISGDVEYLNNTVKSLETLSVFLAGGEEIPEDYNKLLVKGRQDLLVKLLVQNK